MNKVPVISNSQWRTQDFERGEGGQKLQKIWEELNQKLFHPKSVRFFAQN